MPACKLISLLRFLHCFSVVSSMWDDGCFRLCPSCHHGRLILLQRELSESGNESLKTLISDFWLGASLQSQSLTSWWANAEMHERQNPRQRTRTAAKLSSEITVHLVHTEHLTHGISFIPFYHIADVMRGPIIFTERKSHFILIAHKMPSDFRNVKRQK